MHEEGNDCSLEYNHIVVINIWMPKTRCGKLHLVRWKNTNVEELDGFVQNQMAANQRMQGYRWLHLHAVKKMLVVSHIRADHFVSATYLNKTFCRQYSKCGSLS